MWIPKRSSEWTLKEKCKEFWDNYECENKSAFLGFYQKVSHNPDTPREELIVNRKPEPYKYMTKKYSWKYPELFEWYSKQPNPGVKFAIFVARIRDGWYPKEVAIDNWQIWEKAKQEKAERGPRKAKEYVRTYSNTPLKETIENEDDLYIKIKYPIKVARVFAKEYEDIIEDLEWRVRNAPTKEERSEIEGQLVKAHTEYMVFKCYNGM